MLSRIFSQVDRVRIIWYQSNRFYFLVCLSFTFFFLLCPNPILSPLPSVPSKFRSTPNFSHNSLSTPSQVRFSYFLIGYNFCLFPFLNSPIRVTKKKKKKKGKVKEKDPVGKNKKKKSYKFIIILVAGNPIPTNVLKKKKSITN